MLTLDQWNQQNQPTAEDVMDPKEGESLEQYKARVWNDPDMKQRHPHGDQRNAACEDAYAKADIQVKAAPKPKAKRKAKGGGGSK